MPRHQGAEKDMVAPASRGSFRAPRPKPAMDEVRLCWCDLLRSSARQSNSAGRRIEPAGRGCYPQLFSSFAGACLWLANSRLSLSGRNCATNHFPRPLYSTNNKELGDIPEATAAPIHEIWFGFSLSPSPLYSANKSFCPRHANTSKNPPYFPCLASILSKMF